MYVHNGALFSEKPCVLPCIIQCSIQVCKSAPMYVSVAGRLSVGCGLLDSLLRGGLLVSGLTEIAGTSAAGKTQLCLQLCLTSQLPRSHGGLASGERHRRIYHTKHKHSTKRKSHGDQVRVL